MNAHKTNSPSTGYTSAPFPKERQLVIDSARLGKRKHTIHGLVEIDITQPRSYMQEHKTRTGESLSLTGYIIFCLGKAVAENTAVHAYRDWRGRLIMFDDVDVTTIIEARLGDQLFPLAHIIRGTNRRTYRDIHDEIRSVKSNPQRSPGGQRWNYARLFSLMPATLRILMYRILMRFPHQVKNMIGTTIVTAIGMFGNSSGWGIPLTLHTLGITVGGIAKKPAVIDEQIEIHEFLSLTVSFDHDLVDGAPAARFTARLKELIETAYGLE